VDSLSAASHPQISHLHAVVGKQLGRAAARGDAAGLDHVDAVGDGERGAVLEGSKVWLDEALAAGLTPIELEPAELDSLVSKIT
jgi:hypothetical protein